MSTLAVWADGKLVDPAAPDWLAHFAADLAAATEQLGFDGFHLDQYGYPKWATRPTSPFWTRDGWRG